MRGPLETRLAAAVLFLAAAAAWTQQATVAFNWAFVKRAAGGAPAALDFKEKVNIGPGDLFKIHVQPLENAFVYVYLDDAQGELQCLFPSDFSVFEGASYLDQKFFIPGGDNWFALDSARGTERFYLVASSVRLSRLESFTTALGKSTGSSKGTARQAVLDEIARIRKEHSQLTMAAEKPVTVAGSSRGLAAAIQKAATRIEAPGFYYKLFRLEH